MSVDPDKLYIVHTKPKHDSHTDAIRQFEGDFACLSNTYKCAVSLRGDLEPYPSVEHALQASKTEDLDLRATIRQARNAIEAKKIARAIKPTPEWRAGSEKIVEALVRDKFRRNAKARGVLVGTGRVKLVYTNTHEDRVWGVCGGKGDNKLGKLLERVRADALSGKDTDVWCAMRFELALPLDAMVSFVVSKAGQIVAEPSFEGKPVIKMGKLTENEVVMAHPSVSRSHALLVIDRKLGAFLVDLGASNGSFVDGRRLQPYVPEPIKAGGAGLTFAKSKRTYTLSRVETNLRQAKKEQLYASMSDPLASAGQPDPDSTVYVGNLDPSVTEQDIREFFAECGEIASVRVPQDKETGKMRGIAFVAFAKHAGVLQALTLHMDDLKGQSVKIRRADTKPRDGGGSNQQQQLQKQHPSKNDYSQPPPRAGGRAGNAAAGWGQGNRVGGDGRGASVSDRKTAVELATAAVIKAAEASKANAVLAAASAVDPPPKRPRVERSFGEAPRSSENSRSSRWGDSDRSEMGVSSSAMEADEGHPRSSRNGAFRRGERAGRELSSRTHSDDSFGRGEERDSERRHGGRGGDGSKHRDDDGRGEGRGWTTGRGDGRGRRPRDDGRRTGRSGGEGRVYDDEREEIDGGDGGDDSGRRDDSQSYRTGDRGERGFRRGRDDSRDRRDDRDDRGRGGRSDRGRRGDGGGSNNDRRGRSGGSGRFEEERHPRGFSEEGNRRSRESRKRRGEGSEDGSRDRRGGRRSRDDRRSARSRSRSRSRGRR